MWWPWEVVQRSVFKLMTPMVAYKLGWRLDTAFANLKRLLEAQETPLPHKFKREEVPGRKWNPRLLLTRTRDALRAALPVRDKCRVPALSR
jgi:hypothetical protein